VSARAVAEDGVVAGETAGLARTAVARSLQAALSATAMTSEDSVRRLTTRKLRQK
jgi:hypothetical protein